MCESYQSYRGVRGPGLADGETTEAHHHTPLSSYITHPCPPTSHTPVLLHHTLLPSYITHSCPPTSHTPVLLHHTLLSCYITYSCPAPAYLFNLSSSVAPPAQLYCSSSTTLLLLHHSSTASPAQLCCPSFTALLPFLHSSAPLISSFSSLWSTNHLCLAISWCSPIPGRLVFTL